MVPDLNSLTLKYLSKVYCKTLAKQLVLLTELGEIENTSFGLYALKSKEFTAYGLTSRVENARI